MSIRNCRYVAARAHETPDEGFISRAVMDEPRLPYRTADDTLVTLADGCGQRAAPLSCGRRERRATAIAAAQA